MRFAELRAALQDIEQVGDEGEGHHPGATGPVPAPLHDDAQPAQEGVGQGRPDQDQDIVIGHIDGVAPLFHDHVICLDLDR